MTWPVPGSRSRNRPRFVYGSASAAETGCTRTAAGASDHRLIVASILSRRPDRMISQSGCGAGIPFAQGIVATPELSEGAVAERGPAGTPDTPASCVHSSTARQEPRPGTQPAFRLHTPCLRDLAYRLAFAELT